MNVIETANLSYTTAGGEMILNDINLLVPEGAIYGFLGPNGAGKTTTIKLLLGLLKKQAGDIHILGRSFREHRIPLLRQTGALIESPSLYPNLTAGEHLAMMQKIYDSPKKRIPEVLQMTGLANTGNKRVGRFSLGMKQRLALAMTIMHKPSLLILDAPTHGLDPNGIIEMRELLKELNLESGMTILISSHMLAEVEKLVTHIGIIGKGKMLFQGTRAALQAGQEQIFTRIVTNDPHKAAAIARDWGLTATVEQDSIVLPLDDHGRIAALNSRLVAGALAVSQIHTMKNDLESVFIDFLKNKA